LNHIYPIKTKVSQTQREDLLNQRPVLIWFTGLSGSGKSTLAVQLEAQLHTLGFKTYLLDGDNIRKGINNDLGFSLADRTENIRRIAEVSKLMLDAGLIIISAFISPFHADREMVKEIVGEDRFTEIFINCPLEICEKRDTKGLYKKARQGFIRDFTGIDSPYEVPENPDLIVHTHKESVDESLSKIINHVESKLPVTTL